MQAHQSWHAERNLWKNKQGPKQEVESCWIMTSKQYKGSSNSYTEMSGSPTRKLRHRGYLGLKIVSGTSPKSTVVCPVYISGARRWSRAYTNRIFRTNESVWCVAKIHCYLSSSSIWTTSLAKWFKASALRSADLGLIPTLAVDLSPGRVIPVTNELVIPWLPYQPGT